MTTITRQISELTRQRNAVLDRMAAANNEAKASGRAFTTEEETKWSHDEAELRGLDLQLASLEHGEHQLARRAKPMDHPTQLLALPAHGGEKDFPGRRFVRFVGALAAARGNLGQACEFASARWDNSTPEISSILRTAMRLGSSNHEFFLNRAAVAPGSTTDPAWAGPLVNYQVMVAEFVSLLRAETVLGRLTGFRRVPFNIRVPRVTAGSTAQWVGEGASKPVSRLALDQIALPWAKMATIIVITQELARFSSPSAELLVRDDLVAAISEFMDKQLLDDTVTALAGIRPASITNAATKIPSSGGSVGQVTTDLTKAILNITNANIPLKKPVWLMGYSVAAYIASLRTAQDIFAFPSMAPAVTPGQAAGASLMGIPVLISGNVKPGVIILLEQSELMVADDGETTVDSSSEASLQMDDAPATPPTPLVSLFQQNLLAVRAERYAYWMMRRAAAVQEITGAAVPTGL